MWITLVPADFASRLTAGEIAQIARANAQGDNRAEILTEVTNEVRGYVARRNPLGLPGTIPEELKNAALAIATARFINQFPDSGLLTRSREDAVVNAEKLLVATSKGDFAIVNSDNAAAEQPDVPLPSISRERRRFTEREERGL